jgi:hypothetical protein
MASTISCTAFSGTFTGAFAAPKHVLGRAITRLRDAAPAIDGAAFVNGATGPQVWSPPV